MSASSTEPNGHEGDSYNIQTWAIFDSKGHPVSQTHDTRGRSLIAEAGIASRGQGSGSYVSVPCYNQVVGGSPTFAMIANASATNACFTEDTNAVGNVDYWISAVTPQFGQTANGYRVFNISTAGVISADNYLGEPNCTSQSSCITYRTATGIKGNTSSATDSPFATYAIPVGRPNSGPIYFPTDGSPWGVRLSGPSADGSYIVSWMAGASKSGTNPELFVDAQYNGGKPLVDKATVTFSTTQGASQSASATSVTGNVYAYIRAIDATVPSNQGYSYLSPYMSHVVLKSLPTGAPIYYSVSNPFLERSTSAEFSFTPLSPTTPVYPMRFGFMCDNGQTINSSLTATRMSTLDLHAIFHPGDYSYGDNYAANDPNSLIAVSGRNVGGGNDNRHDTFHAMWEKVVSGAPELHCAGNHEVEDGQCANVDSKGNIIGNNTCQLSPTAFNFSFPSNYPFQAFSWRYPAPGATLETIGDINKATYYSTVIGGLIYLITLNNYMPFYPGTPQHTWALSAFAAYNRSATPWFFVQFHSPIYHSYWNHYKETECFASIYEPLFYKYGVDLVMNGHNHAYERTHSMYNYQKDTCGTMHVVFGDGGNVGGPDRNFIDDISPFTGQTYCETLTGGASGPLKATTPHSGGLYYTPNFLPNSSEAVAANIYGKSYQLIVQPNWCPTMSFQVASGVKGGPVAVPYSGPFNVTALNDTRTMYDPSKKYGFCQTSQPTWSAHRDPSFGFAVLEFSSQDVASLKWFRNIDEPGVPADSVTLLRKNSCNRAAGLGNANQVFTMSFSAYYNFTSSDACFAHFASNASLISLQVHLQMAIVSSWNLRVSGPSSYTPTAAGDFVVTNTTSFCGASIYLEGVLAMPVQITSISAANAATAAMRSHVAEDTIQYPAVAASGITSMKLVSASARSPTGPPLIFKTTLTGSAVNVTASAAGGSASVTLVNSSYATGIFYATNIKQMTMAHLHIGTPATVPPGQNGPVIAWAFNATYGPMSGSLKASFSFNPSLNNISSLLAAGQVYFNVHTAANPAGELRGQLTLPTPTPIITSTPTPKPSNGTGCDLCLMTSVGARTVMDKSGHAVDYPAFSYFSCGAPGDCITLPKIGGIHSISCSHGRGPFSDPGCTAQIVDFHN